MVQWASFLFECSSLDFFGQGDESKAIGGQRLIGIIDIGVDIVLRVFLGHLVYYFHENS